MPPGIESDQLDHTERIYGKHLVRLFQELIKNKTVLRVFLLGKDYERLTVITDIEENKSDAYITIDYPGGFKQAVEGTNEWRLRFEFTGKDRLPYIFRTQGGELLKEGIKLRIPNFVERRQRRRNFRLDAPLGTKLTFTKNFKIYVTNVINVSLGGALVSFQKSEQKKPMVEADEYLKGVKISFPSKEGKAEVHIEEAMVKRVQKEVSTGLFNCALEFTHMGNKDRDLLKNLIYRFQREHLRKRQLIDK